MVLPQQHHAHAPCKMSQVPLRLISFFCLNMMQAATSLFGHAKARHFPLTFAKRIEAPVAQDQDCYMGAHL